MDSKSSSSTILAPKNYIIRLPAVILGIIFTGLVLLAACGGDAATATPTAATPTTTPQPTTEPAAAANPTAVSSSPTPGDATEEPDTSAHQQQPLTDDLLAQFTSYIEQSMESNNVPGMAVVIVQDGEVAFAEGFGVKELGGDDPITPDTFVQYRFHGQGNDYHDGCHRGG